MKLLSLLFFLSLCSYAEKPNILFIVSEDNSEQLGCYGDKIAHTPSLDSLAKTGIRYNNAFVPYSVCSPSRAAFLTGLYTRQTGHIGLATHKFSMYKDFKTMPAYFQEAGYFTGFIGKMHINPEHIAEDFIDHRAIRSSNFGKTISIKEYAKHAKLVMKKAQKKKKPFMLIINYPDAHRKYVGTSKNAYPTVKITEPVKPFPWIGADTPQLRKEIQNYYNCMNRLDEGVGMVLKDLEELKLRKNTLIVYISDHGADFARGKGNCYEAGVKVPMIINYPKSFSKGKVENKLVNTIDILPTMLKIAGLKVPKELPGLDLQDLDSSKIKGRKYIHCFTTGSAPSLLGLQFSIRDKRYKLLYNPSRDMSRIAMSRYQYSKIPKSQHYKPYLFPDEYEFYDLKKDPYEWKNLAGKTTYKKTQARLLQEMKSFQKEINDPFYFQKNIETFISEQKKYKKRSSYNKKGFRWPHLKLFEEANK